MDVNRRDVALAQAKIILAGERATLGVMHALTLIESALPLPGTPEHRAAFAEAHRLEANRAA